MPCITSTPAVLLWSRPTIQAVSRLLPTEHRVISGHRVSVVDLLIVVILQGPHSECLQIRGIVITSVSSFQTSPSRQRAHLSGHASSTQASTCVSEQTTPCLRLRVEQINVFKASSTVQCQSWVQTTIPQTLNPLFGAKVHRSHILWSKAHILWSELFIIFILPNRQVGVSTVILFTVSVTNPQTRPPTSESSDPAGGSTQPYTLLLPPEYKNERTMMFQHSFRLSKSQLLIFTERRTDSAYKQTF